MSFNDKVTAKGTKLPLMNLKGKPYLQVAYRIVWFREENPKGNINTYPVEITTEYAIFAATVTDGEGKLLSSGHKREAKGDFGDYVEKAETGAIGRALGAAGYGTQFEPGFDEGDRLADSPMEVPTKTPVVKMDSPKKVSNSGKAKTASILGTNETITSKSSVGTTLSMPAPTVAAVKTDVAPQDKIAAGYKLLETQGKVTKEDFKTKYLQGKGLSKLTEEEARIVVLTMKNDFPELAL